jgi:hypothetical protein
MTATPFRCLLQGPTSEYRFAYESVPNQSAYPKATKIPPPTRAAIARYNSASCQETIDFLIDSCIALSLLIPRNTDLGHGCIRANMAA